MKQTAVGEHKNEIIDMLTDLLESPAYQTARSDFIREAEDLMNVWSVEKNNIK